MGVTKWHISGAGNATSLVLGNIQIATKIGQYIIAEYKYLPT
jgi:hypothetical protein